MSQNSLNDSEIRSSKIGLKPAIAAALASLEVQLDQELTRYRRSRSLRNSSHPSLGVNFPGQPQQISSISVLQGKNQPSVIENPMTVTPQEIVSPNLTKTKEPDHLPISALPEESTPTPTLPPKIDSSSSLVPTLSKTSDNDKLLPPPEHTPQHPDDYLESSEALLRSLTEAPPEIQKSRSNSDSLLSPLGIGSMLLLILASLTLGYVVLNPKTLPNLNLAKFFDQSPAPTEKKTEVIKNEPQSTEPVLESAELKPIPKYPNLAANEFPEVRNPNDVVGLKPKPQPIPVATSTPLTIPSPVIPVAPLNVSPLPTLPPLKLATPPSSSPLNAQIKPSADGFYHLVTENQGSGALAIARQIVPDAYLSKDKKFIYLGAVKNKEEIQPRLQQLQDQGIKAHIQQPEKIQNSKFKIQN